MDADRIARLLTEAREAYYETEEPLMSDVEFDALEEDLRQIDPRHPWFGSVGTLPEAGKKIRHDFPMLSMGKAKSMEEADKWLKRLALPEGTEFCLQPKIDGLSATCRYRGGDLVYVATRGDGKEGQDVTHIAPYIKDIPPRITFTAEDIEIRGELYLPRDTALDTGGRPLRNNCVGLINRKENREDLKHVRFVCYQLARVRLAPTESEHISLLKRNGFHTVVHEVFSDMSGLEKRYNAYLNRFREEWLYETDGLILTVNSADLHEEIDSRWVVDHHHHYNLALKPPSAGKKTRLLGVEWQVSRQGNLVPVALFEPVILGGASLSRATLHNYRFARSLLLAPGDGILVERANDVIPYIKDNPDAVRRDEEGFIQPLMAVKCPACGSSVAEEGVHLRCQNPECPEKRLQMILYWVRQAGIENVAGATLRTLMDKGKLNRIRDLYTLTPEDFSGLEGFADKKVDNFVSEVRKARSLTAADLISRLGIPLVQKKSLEKLEIRTLQDFLGYDDITYVIGRNIVSWKEDLANRQFLEELLEVVEIVPEKELPAGEIRGTVCMTGKGPYPRNELLEKAAAMGYRFTDTVTKETTLLVCDEPEGESSKLKKARQWGVPIMTYTDFFKG
jgi:DNA ligase (NAD+)